jgi:EmrB/QacA subfamily drug resistance transporter
MGPGARDGEAAESIRAMVPMMVVLSAGAVMTIFDSTIVNVALDSLGRDLKLSLTEAQWVSTAYLLTLAFGVPLTGWLTERLGSKRLWMSALTLFLAGSVLCAVSWSAGSLIAFRVVQGLGGGMVMPVGQAIIVRRIGRDRMGRVMGLLTMPLLLGPVLGPIIGGTIVDSVSWRWIFLINVPIGLPTLLLASRMLRNSYPDARHKLDVRGLALLPPGLVILVYGLSRLNTSGGSVDGWTIGCLAAGVLLIVAFYFHARTRGRGALIDIGLFRRVEYRAATVIAFFFGLLMFGGFFVLPLYYQIVRGESALHAGLLVAPQGIGSMLVLPLAGRLSDRFGAGRVVPVGLALAAAATWVFAHADATTSYAALAVAQFLRGVGMSSVMTPTYAAAYAGLQRDEVPRATSAVNVINRVGGSVGAALLAVVLAHGIAGVVPGAGGADGLGAVGALDHAARAAVAPQLATVFNHAYWALFGCTLIAFIPAAFLPRPPLRIGSGRRGQLAAEPDGGRT